MQRSNRRKAFFAAAVAATASLVQLQSAASAATHTWNGTTDANWGTATNWSSGAVPNANTEDVVFNTSGAGNLNVNANTGTFTIRSLTFGADATNPVVINVGGVGTLIINGQTGDDVTVTAGAHKIQGVSSTVSEVKLNATDFNIASGASLELAARLIQNASSNSYSKSGAGTLIISAQNGSGGGWNFTGGTFTINGGAVVLRSSQAMGNSSNRVAINSGAAMQLENGSYVATNGVVALNNGGTLRAVGATSNRAIGAGTGQIFLTGASSIDANDGTMTLTQDIAGGGSFTKIGAGTLVLNDGGANTANTYTGNTTISTGTLALGATGTFGVSPRVEVQSGAALNVTAAGYNVPAGQTLAGNGTVYGNVNLAGANSAIAPGSTGAGTLTLTNDLSLTSGQLKLDLGNANDVGNGVNDLVVVGGNLNLSGNTLLNINRTAGSVAGTYTILQYAGTLGGAGTLSAPVVRQGLTVDTTSSPGFVKLVVGAGSAGNIKWKGNGSDSTWQTNGSNVWDNSGAADKYFDWDDVTFSDDLGSNSPNVTVSGTVVPNSVTINNSVVDYTFGGSGAILGVNTLTKTGSRSATFSNTGGVSASAVNVNGGTLLANTPVTATNVTLGGGALRLTNTGAFASTTINSGTLEIGDGATAGSVSGSITNNGWVTLNNPGDNTYGNTQSGTGSVEKKGTGVGTLSGDLSGLTGDFKVSGGIVRPTVNGSFGATTGTGGSATVVNGAQIDLGSGAGTNSLNFGTRQFNVVGAGPDGSGVIINNHATRAQQNAFQNVRLLGDATFGGTSRFDIRSAAGTLDLAGNTLHKIGNMQLSLVGVSTVTDGNIQVHAGTFSIETTTNMAGNGTVTFDNGTVMQFFSLSGNVTRPMVTTGAITINNASGTGTASVVGSPIRLGGDATVTATSGTPGTLALNGAITDDGGVRSIVKNNANMLIFGGANTYGGNTTVNAGTLQVTPTGNVGAGLLANGPSTLVDFVAGRSTAVKVSQITIDGTGTVDLHDNDMVIGAATPMSSVETYVKNARNNGTWNAPGLTSSPAAANSTTGIGVISGAEYNSVGGTGTFSGQTYGASDTLVKYTWNGDANLDGRVTFDDYVKIDTGFNTHLTGWLNGDFNYSGAVNFDDYVMIDIAFNQQNGTLGRAIDWISGDDRSTAGLDSAGMGEVIGHLNDFGASYGAAFLAAVPEPSSLLVLGVPALAGLSRRRRRAR